MTTLSAPLWGWFVVFACILSGLIVSSAILFVVMYYICLACTCLWRAIEDCDWSEL